MTGRSRTGGTCGEPRRRAGNARVGRAPTRRPHSAGRAAPAAKPLTRLRANQDYTIDGSRIQIGGLLIPVPPLSRLGVQFPAISGQVASGPAGVNGADGGTHYGGVTDVQSYDGIAGIRLAGSTMFLTGVFLDEAEPVGAAPPRLDFTGDVAFARLSTELRQPFFIGDGPTGTGSGAVQPFHVPPGATRLLLGFADASFFVVATGSTTTMTACSTSGSSSSPTQRSPSPMARGASAATARSPSSGSPAGRTASSSRTAVT